MLASLQIVEALLPFTARCRRTVRTYRGGPCCFLSVYKVLSVITQFPCVGKKHLLWPRQGTKGQEGKPANPGERPFLCVREALLRETL